MRTESPLLRAVHARFRRPVFGEDDRERLEAWARLRQLRLTPGLAAARCSIEGSKSGR